MREDSFVIEGGRKLCGEIDIQGSKNSVLPILAATVLAEKKCIIHNCPNLSDVDSAIAILRHLGCSVIRYENSVEVDASCISRFDIP